MDEAVIKFLTDEMKFDEEGVQKFEDLGIRTLADFAEMDEADMRKLKLNKFDTHRLYKGLQRTVPRFVVDGPLNEALDKMSNMQPVPEVKDPVAAWLETARLEQYADQLRNMGVRCVEDASLLEEDDIQSLKMSKFDSCRFAN